jgi:hypothetical protein
VSAPATAPETGSHIEPDLAAPGQFGVKQHSHVGGRDVGVGSHAHRVGSADLARHAAPTGKEEAWRFTPLRRLRGLHADAPFAPNMESESLLGSGAELPRPSRRGAATQRMAKPRPEMPRSCVRAGCLVGRRPGSLVRTPRRRAA